MNKPYWPGINIIPIVLTAYLFYGIYVNLTVGVYIQKKTRYMALFTGLAAITNVGSNFYLMPHYGIMGAAVATLLSYLVMAITIFVANQKIYYVPYEYGRLAFILFYLTGMLTIFYLFSPTWPLRLLIVALTPVLFYLFRFFKKEELAFLLQTVKKAGKGQA